MRLQQQQQKRNVMTTLAIAGMLTALVAAMLVTGFGRVSAQGTATTPTANPPHQLGISGEGRVTATPDIATVSVGVETTQRSLAEAQSEATTKMDAIIQVAKDAGVADDDIVTSNYAVSVIQDYDRNGNPAKISGYSVSNQVELTVRQVDDLGTLLESVVSAGANSIYGVAFSVKDPTAAASQARSRAVEDARQKADELAEAAGVEITAVLSITESSSASAPPEVFQAEMSRASDSESSAAPVPIQAGTNEIVVDVQIVYEISG